MSMHRAAIALSLTALAMAILGQTPVGQAAAGAVRVALLAQNSDRVNGIQAARTPRPGRLLALNAKGQFPASALPSGTGAYTHTIVVHPDQNPTKAGTELLSALAGITDGSATNPYLVKIEPGIYDLGTRSLAMKQHVDVEGSGEAVTTVTAAVPTGSGTVVGADHSELRLVTVKNTGGGGQHSAALFSESTSPRYTHVTAASSGGTENYGVYISNGSPILTDVVAGAAGGARAVGLVNFNGNTAVVNSTLTASDGAGLNAGLLTSFGGSVRVLSSTVTASGGAIAIGMRSYSGSHSLANATVSGSGSGQSYGIYNGQKSSTPGVAVHQSRVSGQTNSVFVLGGSVRVGASQLSGPAATQDPGTVVCAASYDGGFAALGAGCG